MPPQTDLSRTIADNLARVRERIADAEARYGRPPGSVALLAVSKRHGAERIQAAHAAGQTLFGESYVQEALDKQAALSALPLGWHFIGRVQTNKTRDIAAHFDWVHGLCELKHARRLGAQRPATAGPLPVCVQVNLSGEASKAGLLPEQVSELLDQCRDIAGISVAGLMTLPAPADDLAEQRRPFAALRALRDRLATPALPLTTLSMGMTADLEAAVAEGATMVRVGTAVFGPRPPAGER
ncbi:YggS family pyridoxal phosphate-dependent enzyme [uncultured Thiohalocapsa sp.]|uniref:YggS family pyridoxal phosphate-dependent enzyme n=1 Tax=uncultured Thiohalocapsa sp. TaxID=768990 RepID=UPI0025E60559|nr:YggS family pyridoxal phosphate-dependent enzyme [uncultured Thiohalocapsa sp.]